MPAVKPSSRSRKPGTKRRNPGMKRAAIPPAPRGGPESAAALEGVRSVCLALPDTTEKIAWGAPTFRVRERLFVMFVDNHHGDGRLAIWVNAAPGAQDAFVANDPERYFIPPYVGPSGWLGVRLDRGLSPSEVAARVRAAHAATLAAILAKKGARTAKPRARRG